MKFKTRMSESSSDKDKKRRKQKKSSRVDPGLKNKPSNQEIEYQHQQQLLGQEQPPLQPHLLPTGSPGSGYQNIGMNTIKGHKDNRMLEKFKVAGQQSAFVTNALNMINTKKSASKWKTYVSCKRTIRQDDNQRVSEASGRSFGRRCSGMGIDDQLDMQQLHGKKEITIECNKMLINYFAKLGKTDPKNPEVNQNLSLDFVEQLLKGGALINCTDKHGQTIFHEVARIWHVDVARFLMAHSADPDQPDKYGRTPIHVAAAVDYDEMVQFLIDNKVDKERPTTVEKQTPVHFAARNDACNSLKTLVRAGCDFRQVRDYKGRTPLHLAAELDRSETARLLLDLNADAGVTDNSGQSAIVWMIAKMAPVAKDALDQFHVKDRANRKQYYYLHHLEPLKPGDEDSAGYPSSALETLVQYRLLDMVQHDVIRKIITIKWEKYGRFGAWKAMLLNFLFTITWTVFAIGTGSPEEKNIYKMPDHWWRILIFLLGGLLWIYLIKEEIVEFYSSSKNFKNWKKWREGEIQKDIDRAHPRWPEEKTYSEQEMKDLDKVKPQYFNDFWNYFDWFCYFMLTGSIVTHIVDIYVASKVSARIHINIMAVNIVIIWLRLMKNARAFAFIGPFIVMLGHMMTDFIKFAILYCQFYIPYACAFWMLFGGSNRPVDPYYVDDPYGNSTVSVQWMASADQLLFTLFRLTLVDEYDYTNMKKADYWMADILLGTWFAFSAVLCLNLLIALLSDTFQRVYDNAQANAVMQKAILILSIEERQTSKRRRAFKRYLETKCAPKDDDYDDDLTEVGDQDLKKVTIQIKEQLDDMKEKWEPLLKHYNEDAESEFQNKTHSKSSAASDASNRVTVERFENEVEQLKVEMRRIQDGQDEMMEKITKDLTKVMSLLQQVASGTGAHIYDSIYVSKPVVDTNTTHQYESVPQAGSEHDERRKRRKKSRKHHRNDGNDDEARLLNNQESVESSSPQSVRRTHLNNEPKIDITTHYTTDTLNDGTQVRQSADRQSRIQATILNMETMPSAEC